MTDKFNQVGSINENWLAEEITSREAGLKEIDIAQVREILKITLDILAELSIEGDEEVAGRVRVIELLKKHRGPE